MYVLDLCMHQTCTYIAFRCTCTRFHYFPIYKSLWKYVLLYSGISRIGSSTSLACILKYKFSNFNSFKFIQDQFLHHVKTFIDLMGKLIDWVLYFRNIGNYSLPSQSRTKRENYVKFLFTHFFVVLLMVPFEVPHRNVKIKI